MILTKVQFYSIAYLITGLILHAFFMNLWYRVRYHKGSFPDPNEMTYGWYIGFVISVITWPIFVPVSIFRYKTAIKKPSANQAIIVIVGFILFLTNSRANAQSWADSLVPTGLSSSITTGLNPVTKELLPGSDWGIQYSNANAGSCSALASSGYIYNDGTVDKTGLNYTETSGSCSSITIPEDPGHTVTWFDQGEVQESFFDNETLACGEGTNCDINQYIDYLSQNFATVNPTNGTKGSRSGNTEIFMYNYNTLYLASNSGSQGLGGLANLPTNPQSIKYCKYLRDVSTDGRTSTYAKNPELRIKVITWRPFIQGPNGVNGQASGSESVYTNIFKGLSSNMRYWIGKDSILEENLFP